MNATEPTYFLYSGRLFHESALPALLAQKHRSGDVSAAAPSSGPHPRPEDPGPEGPEGEPVGEEDEDEDDESESVTTQRERPEETGTESKPLPGPGMPVVPEHGSPDANPIDPRVF